MQILLARHGNTFGPGDKVIWVGRETDLPLVAKGVEQAHAVAAALAGRGLVPSRILCGALRRTKGYAEIIAGELGGGVVPEVDRRLDEIDYGRWAGRTGEEIAATLGQGEQLRRWREEDLWPVDAGWGSTEAEIAGGIEALLAEVREAGRAGERWLVVSSNGVLRFVPRLLGLAHPAGAGMRTFQMKTGHMAVLDYRDGAFALRCWDVAPGDLIA